MSARVLVTGGAGYLGAVLVPALLSAGYRVTVLDNFCRPGTQTSLAACCADEGFSVVRGDARDEGLVRRLAVNVDYVVPLAALVGAPLCAADPIAAESTNFGAVDMLCRVLSPEQKIVIPITNSGYGIGEPGKECTEESPLRPVSLYGTTKVQAERRVLDRGNAISLRLATVFGMSPRMRLDLLVNDFVYRAVTDRAIVLFEPHFKRNYVHVRDVASAFLFALGHFDAMKDNAFNVGLSTANLSKAELCQVIARHTSFSWTEMAVGEDPDKRDYVVSNEKIARAGWVPYVQLGDGIRELLVGYRMLRNAVYGNV